MLDQTEQQTGYHIKFVPEGYLPSNEPWVFFEYDGELWLAIKQVDVSPDTLEECWAAFRRMAGCDYVSTPKTASAASAAAI